MIRVFQDMHAPLPDSLADGHAGREQWAALARQPVGLYEVVAIGGVDGFGSGLQDEKLTGLSVLGPLYVHRLRASGALRIMVFDDAGPAGELQHLVVTERETLTLRLDDAHFACALVVETVNHLDLLAAETAADDGARAHLQSRLEDDPFIRRRFPRYDGFAQAPRAVNHHRIAKARFRIEREHHARTGQVGAHHRLHADGERDLEMIEAARGAIRDRAICPQ